MGHGHPGPLGQFVQGPVIMGSNFALELVSMMIRNHVVWSALVARLTGRHVMKNRAQVMSFVLVRMEEFYQCTEW